MTGQLDWVELFFSSAGRLARGPFWLAAIVLLVLLTLYEAITGPTLRLLTGWLFYPGLLFAAACVLSKRLHDRGRTGWLAAVILVAIVAVWPSPAGFFDFLFSVVIVWGVVELGVLTGEQGANRYGPNPLKSAAA
jgi:uncharacterized membrane protein YhaH (DUF805 family)